MADLYSRKKRSAVMAAIKGKNTGPEIETAKALRRLGMAARRHRKDLPFRPDFALRDHRAVILVHGCFWHGHLGCSRAKLPATNKRFWRRKIAVNIARDSRQRRQLRAAGWKIATLWTCKKITQARVCSALRRVGISTV